MSNLKRKNIQDSIEISDGEGPCPPAKRAKKHSPHVTVDLTQDASDSDSDDEVVKTAAPAAKLEPPSSSPPTEIEDHGAVQPDRPISPVLPVERGVSKMAEIPEVADRYVPIINVEQNTEYRNPFKFCVKPPYWQKWSGIDYINFVEELRSQFGEY